MQYFHQPNNRMSPRPPQNQSFPGTVEGFLSYTDMEVVGSGMLDPNLLPWIVGNQNANQRFHQFYRDDINSRYNQNDMPNMTAWQQGCLTHRGGNGRSHIHRLWLWDEDSFNDFFPANGLRNGSRHNYGYGGYPHRTHHDRRQCYDYPYENYSGEFFVNLEDSMETESEDGAASFVRMPPPWIRRS
jgi:hypothetical protein